MSSGSTLGEVRVAIRCTPADKSSFPECFKWVREGSILPSSSSLWYSGNPNADHPTEIYCARFKKYSGVFWLDDGHCSNTKYYFCQIIL